MSESKGSASKGSMELGSSQIESADLTANPADRIKGVVKWFNDAKGFGFIEHTTGRDVFVHYSVIQQEGFKTLEDGEEVEYEVKEGPKGLHAVRVDRVNFKPSDLSATDLNAGEGAAGEAAAIPAGAQKLTADAARSDESQ